VVGRTAQCHLDRHHDPGTIINLIQQPAAFHDRFITRRLSVSPQDKDDASGMRVSAIRAGNNVEVTMNVQGS
jgi:hypothetical protein